MSLARLEFLQHAYWVDGATNNSTQRIPCSIVKPIPKVIEALLGQELRDAVVEVWIKLVYHAFVLDDREET